MDVVGPPAQLRSWDRSRKAFNAMRSRPSHRLRGLSVGALALGIGLIGLPVQADGAPANHPLGGSGTNYAARARSAAVWQASQLHNGRMPGFSPGNPDWGLTIDTAYMIAAQGTQPVVLAQIRNAIGHHILDYAVYQGDTSSGAMAKALLVSEVLNGNPTHFGGLNLRARVLHLVAPPSAGFEAGRLRDTGSTDYSNVFGQSYGTIGLSRSGPVPQRVVDYLLKQRCSDGYFHLYETAGKSCDATGDGPDVDATALALQALLAARRAGAEVSLQVIKGTTTWLISAQNVDGSYSEDGTANAKSSNSTGLAANALFATGHNGPRLKAAAWVARQQITASRAHGGPAKPDIGAIALNHLALFRALAHGLGDGRSQWWRVAPQAFYALHPAPLGDLRAP